MPIGDVPHGEEPLSPSRPNRRAADHDHGYMVPDMVPAVRVLLLLAVTLVFGQAIGHDFVNYDDPRYVWENPHVARGLTPEGLVWVFTHSHGYNWHPLTGLSHMLDCQLFGLWAEGHHVVNVLLHGGTAVLLFLVLRQMTGRFWPSVFVAAVFTIHPLRVESVAWVSERKDVLSGLFFMLTLAAYLGYVRRPFSLARYLLVVLPFALGLMAKPMLVTLPFVLLLLDYWPLGRWQTGTMYPCSGSREQGAGGHHVPMVGEKASTMYPWSGSGDTKALSFSRVSRVLRRCFGPIPAPCSPPPSAPRSLLPAPCPLPPARLLVEKLPLLALAAAACVATVLAQTEAMRMNVCVSLPWRIGNALVSYVAYMGQLFCPLGLAVFYPHPENHLPIWKVVAACLVLAGISLGALARAPCTAARNERTGRRRPYLLVGWLWYLGMLVPTIGLLQVGFQAMADRYTYLPQIGLSIALAWGVAEVSQSWPYRRWVCGVGSALVMASLMACAWLQTSHWRNSQTLWTHAVACNAQNARAHSYLGMVLSDLGQLDEAIAHFHKALEIKPDEAEARLHLGYALEQAVISARRAVELAPHDPDALDVLATAYAEAGRFAEAEQTACEAVDLATHQSNLALAESIQTKSRLHEAGAQFRDVRQCPPSGPVRP